MRKPTMEVSYLPMLPNRPEREPDETRAVPWEWIDGPLEPDSPPPGRCVWSRVGYTGTTWAADPLDLGPVAGRHRYYGSVVFFLDEPCPDPVEVQTGVFLPPNTNFAFTRTEPTPTCYLRSADGTLIREVTGEPWANCPGSSLKRLPNDAWDLGTRKVPRGRMFEVRFLILSTTELPGQEPYALIIGYVRSEVEEPKAVMPNLPVWVWPQTWTTPGPPDFTGVYEGTATVTHIPEDKTGPDIGTPEEMKIEIMQSGRKVYMSAYQQFFTPDGQLPDEPQARATGNVGLDDTNVPWARFPRGIRTSPYGIVWNFWSLTIGNNGLLRAVCRNYLDPSLDFTVTGSLTKKTM